MRMCVSVYIINMTSCQILDVCMLTLGFLSYTPPPPPPPPPPHQDQHDTSSWDLYSKYATLQFQTAVHYFIHTCTHAHLHNITVMYFVNAQTGSVDSTTSSVFVSIGNHKAFPEQEKLHIKKMNFLDLIKFKS